MKISVEILDEMPGQAAPGIYHAINCLPNTEASIRVELNGNNYSFSVYLNEWLEAFSELINAARKGGGEALSFKKDLIVSGDVFCSEYKDGLFYVRIYNKECKYDYMVLSENDVFYLHKRFHEEFYNLLDATRGPGVTIDGVDIHSI